MNSGMDGDKPRDGPGGREAATKKQLKLTNECWETYVIKSEAGTSKADDVCLTAEFTARREMPVQLFVDWMGISVALTPEQSLALGEALVRWGKQEIDE